MLSGFSEGVVGSYVSSSSVCFFFTAATEKWFFVNIDFRVSLHNRKCKHIGSLLISVQFKTIIIYKFNLNLFYSAHSIFNLNTWSRLQRILTDDVQSLEFI